MPLLPGLALWALTAGPAEAQPSDGPPPPPAPRAPRNHLGASVMGVAGFLRHNVGSFEVFYERILGRRHGLRLAGDFLHVHHNSDAVQSHQWTFGGTLSYRLYHRDGAGLFGGLKAGYRRGTGHFGPPHPDPGHVHLQSEQVLVLPQVGYRFLLPRADIGREVIGEELRKRGAECAHVRQLAGRLPLARGRSQVEHGHRRHDDGDQCERRPVGHWRLLST